MRNDEMLNRIYNAYNGEDVTYQEMLTNSKRFIEDVFRCYSYHYEQQEKYKIFTIFCAWIAACDGAPNRTEYEFFVKFSGLNVSYEYFRNIGIEMANNKKAALEFRDLNKNKLRSGTIYDYSTNIIALCMCGCDGKINNTEKEFLNEYICHPDYNPL